MGTLFKEALNELNTQLPVNLRIRYKPLDYKATQNQLRKSSTMSVYDALFSTADESLLMVSIQSERRASIAYMESTCSVDISIPPTFFSNLFHCLCHVSPSISKNNPNKSFFNPIKYI